MPSPHRSLSRSLPRRSLSRSTTRVRRYSPRIRSITRRNCGPGYSLRSVRVIGPPPSIHIYISLTYLLPKVAVSGQTHWSLLVNDTDGEYFDPERMPFDPKNPGKDVRLQLNNPKFYSKAQLEVLVQHIQRSWLATSPIEDVFMLKIPPGTVIPWKSRKTTTPAAKASTPATMKAVPVTSNAAKAKRTVKKPKAQRDEDKDGASEHENHEIVLRSGRKMRTSEEDLNLSDGMDWEQPEGKGGSGVKAAGEGDVTSSDEDGYDDLPWATDGKTIGLSREDWAVSHPSMMEDTRINRLFPGFDALLVSAS